MPAAARPGNSWIASDDFQKELPKSINGPVRTVSDIPDAIVFKAEPKAVVPSFEAALGARPIWADVLHPPSRSDRIEAVLNQLANRRRSAVAVKLAAAECRNDLGNVADANGAVDRNPAHRFDGPGKIARRMRALDAPDDEWLLLTITEHTIDVTQLAIDHLERVERCPPAIRVGGFKRRLRRIDERVRPERTASPSALGISSDPPRRLWAG